MTICNLTVPVRQCSKSMSQPVRHVPTYIVNCICRQANMQPPHPFATLDVKTVYAPGSVHVLHM